jgi:Flp pilus assembly secretin CpaC
MIQTEAELSRIQVLEEAFGKQIENQTELSPGLLESGRSRVSTWIETQKLQGLLRIETLGGHLWVRGSAPDQATLGSWRKTLRSTFPATQIELSTLPDSSRTLFFRVFFLEMKKSALRQLGLQWPSHLSGSLLLEGGSLFWSQPPSVELSLQWLEGKGWAKVLSRPELVVRVPGEAELFNGGEIPLEIRSRAGNRAGAWIEWKPYGLTLKLKTLFCTADQVRFEVSSEISELDRANGTATLPALQASRVKSQIDARIGEPIFLSGLLQEKTGSQTQGWPGLSQIPLLGKLFGSEDFVHQRSELVAVILPLNAPPPAVGMRSESELALGMKPELALGLKPEPAPVSAHRFSTGFDPALRPLLERARP